MPEVFPPNYAMQLRRRAQSSAASGVSRKTFDYATAAQTSDPKMETHGPSRLAYARSLRETDSTCPRHCPKSSHPLGPRSVGAVFYLHSDRPAHPAPTALAGAGTACWDQFSPGGSAAGTAAVNITERVMFGNRKRPFLFWFTQGVEAYTGCFVRPALQSEM